MDQLINTKWMHFCIGLVGMCYMLHAGMVHSKDNTTFRAIVVVEMNECCTEQAYPDAERALRDELRLLHIPVIRKTGVETGDTAQRQELERFAKAHNAAAAVRLTRTRTSGPADVSLWITDQITRKTVYRRIEIDESSELSLPMLVAMRTVETLRASLLEFHYDNHQDEKEVSPELQKIVDTPHFLPFFRLGFGASSGLTMSPGGAGIRAAFATSCLIQPVHNLDISVSANWSPFGGSYSAAGVRSTVTYLQVRGWLHYRLVSGSLLRPAIGVGAGAFMGQAKGESEDGTTIKIARTYVPYVGLSTRVYIFASERIPFYVDTSVGLLLPEAQVVHGDTPAATIGKPLIELRFGLELRFWKK